MANILIVEDDEALSEAICDWLTHHEHSVETAADGLEAQEVLRFGTFELIIMDWQIPHIDGLQVCKNFRAAGGTTPILILSGNDLPTDRQKAIDAGANDFLKKPFALAKLTQHMQSLLRKARVKFPPIAEREFS